MTLESIANLRRYAPLIMTQTVVNKAMPLGNQTGMTDADARNWRLAGGAEMTLRANSLDIAAISAPAPRP